jgi:NADPH2 dehydrogenase
VSAFPKVAQLKTVDALRRRLAELGVEMPIEDRILSAREGSPLASPLSLGPLTAGNRWCIHPMEGWDANTDGSPTAHTLRRWKHFGESGAKLIWGGEAAAVMHDGRANPHQVLATRENREGLAALLKTLKQAHLQKYGTTDDLVIGLQLTHSGRFSRPNSKRLEPRIAYHHPLLDGKFGIPPSDDSIVWTDAKLYDLIDRYVESATIAQEVGFDFVDVKACHGYLLHEFLSARSRPGEFGGTFAGRTNLLKRIITSIQHTVPRIAIGVRLSVFDMPPFESADGVGKPMDYSSILPYECGFGLDSNHPLREDLSEPISLLRELAAMGVIAVNVSCASPYYNPHLMRPAAFPPSDGYPPPEDPLVGVARQLNTVRGLKHAVPAMPLIGSGYSYLQDYLPHVAQAAIRDCWVDAVGLGRMVLSYPELPADVLLGATLARKRICRTFSDCTTAPRNGIISGCYPLDDYYKSLDEFEALRETKAK